jgi:hydrogenase maturation protease
MFDPTKKTLMVGIGNSSRGDDALGWAFANQAETFFPEIHFHYCYQLQVEDADLISQYEQVFFVDASHEQIPDGFRWSKVEPSAAFEFTTHRMSPSNVMWLCKEVYNKIPIGYLLAISGRQWELGELISQEAIDNLLQAMRQFTEWFDATEVHSDE